MNVEMLPNPPSITDTRPAELLYIKGDNGWKTINNATIRQIDRIVYLGNCRYDGDMFAIHYCGAISFCKGVLNNGNFKQE